VKSYIRKYAMQRVEPLDKDKWGSCCGSYRPMSKQKDGLNRFLID